MLQHPRAADKIECSIAVGKSISCTACERESRLTMLAQGRDVRIQAAGECDQRMELLHHAATSTAQVKHARRGKETLREQIAIDVAAGKPTRVQGSIALAKPFLLVQ